MLHILYIKIEYVAWRHDIEMGAQLHAIQMSV